MMLSSGTIYSTLHSLEGKGLIQSDMRGRSRTCMLTDNSKSFIDTLMGDHHTQRFLTLLEKTMPNVHGENLNLNSDSMQMQKTSRIDD